MGPWGPNMPLTPERARQWLQPPKDEHCADLCCDSEETCRCDCSWCDCRYAVRLGS